MHSCGVLRTHPYLTLTARTLLTLTGRTHMTYTGTSAWIAIALAARSMTWRKRRIDRTLTHHERAYDNLAADEQLTAQVRLTLTDGSTCTAKVVHPRGTGDRNLTNADIRDKYAKLTHGVISAER
jgi:2-methylcitrate dehydratase PrpD